MEQSAVVRLSVTQSELFSSWPDWALSSLMTAADMITFKPEAEIYCPGDSAQYLILVASGSIIFSRLPLENRPLTMGRYSAGNFYGLGPVLTQSSYIHYVVSREETLLVRIPGATLRGLVSQDGTLAFSLFAALERRHSRARDLYVSAAVFSLRARIAGLLRSHSQSPSHAGGTVEINLSQEEIGQMLGTRRQAVNRILREMVELGVLKVLYGKVLITDYDKLKLMAEDSSHMEAE